MDSQLGTKGKTFSAGSARNNFTLARFCLLVPSCGSYAGLGMKEQDELMTAVTTLAVDRGLSGLVHSPDALCTTTFSPSLVSFSINQERSRIEHDVLRELYKLDLDTGHGFQMD